jgi:aminomethyltransferase
MSPAETPVARKTTVLARAHAAAKARMVGFAGYEMPLQYPDGVLAEHRWTRAHAGLFDVSHMGPARLVLNARSADADADHRRLAALIEPLVSADVRGLAPGRLRYALLLDDRGGILDDLMIGRPAARGELFLVVNAGPKEADFRLIADAAGDAARLVRADDGGLIALQGPEAAPALAALVPGVADLGFMGFAPFDHEGERFIVSRSGYTGEDGFEVLGRGDAVARLWSRLLADPRVRPAGLGARDSLRLEAGLPLFGHDLDPSVSPVEAGLGFAVSRRRLAAGDLRGAARLRRELEGDVSRVRVGLRVLEGAPAREGADILHDGQSVGRVTSGGFSPTLSIPIAMGFVPPPLAQPGQRLNVVVRGRPQAADVVALPFVPHRYARKP